MNKKTYVTTFISMLFLVALIVGLGSIKAQAAKLVVPENDYLAIDQQDETAVLILSNQIQDVNAAEIELSDVRLGKLAITGIVCYPVPSDADWLIEGISLTVEDKVSTDYKITLKEWLFSNEGVKTQRCDYLVIPLTKSINAPSITISIKRLATTLPDVPDCVKVQERLDAAQTGIVIGCEYGPGYFDFEIMQRPESMSEITAAEIIRDAFHDEIIVGPWVFEIPITP